METEPALLVWGRIQEEAQAEEADGAGWAVIARALAQGAVVSALNAEQRPRISQGCLVIL